MTDSVTDSFSAKGTLVLVSDKMQRNYRYRRTEPPGKNFAPNFPPNRPPSGCSPQAFSEENT
jgi:hypothetical protein